MTLDTIKKHLQEHLSDGLVRRFVGSGLSCAEGLPDMEELAQHLSGRTACEPEADTGTALV